MLKLIFIISLLLIADASEAQFTYHGRVFKGKTGEYMTFGDVLVRTGVRRESRMGTKVTQLDSLGYFVVTLKDSANVRFYIDCSLEGYAIKTVSHQDTLIQFTIAVLCNDFNVEKAKRDIQENELCLLYNGTIYDIPESATDKAFQIKYGVKYINFLDSPKWMDCIRLYNGEIARHLDKKYGKSWREEMRHDIQTY